MVYIRGTVSQYSNVSEMTMICIHGILSAKHLQEKKEYFFKKVLQG